MKISITKISSTILALLVLLSTFSLTIEKHFCGDFLVDISYFGSTQGCADEEGDDSCYDPKKIERKKCCTDQVHQIEGQDDLSTHSIKKVTLKEQFALAFTVSYYNLFVNLEKQIVPHKQYYPPNLVADIQVLHEVFIV